METLKLEIEISEIAVTGDFYEVHYRYRFDGKKWQSDMLDGDYENGMTEKQWKKELQKGVAMESVLQKISEELVSELGEDGWVGDMKWDDLTEEGKQSLANKNGINQERSRVRAIINYKKI